jgi:hypothetical protein
VHGELDSMQAFAAKPGGKTVIPRSPGSADEF